MPNEHQVLAALLAPIPGDSPAGRDLRYDPRFDTVREARREDADLPKGAFATERKLADWGRVQQDTAALLSTESKDLQLAAWHTEALLRRAGLKGLAGGLALIAGLLDQYWDGLFPEIEGGDAELRLGPLEWVGSRLDTAVRSVPVAESGLSFYDLRVSRGVPTEAEAKASPAKQEERNRKLAEGKIAPEVADAAVAATPKAFYKTLVADIAAATAALDMLERSSDARFEDDPPDYRGLRTALDELQRFAATTLAQRLELDPDPVEETVDDDHASAADMGPPVHAPSLAATAPCTAVQWSPPRVSASLAPERSATSNRSLGARVNDTLRSVVAGLGSALSAAGRRVQTGRVPAVGAPAPGAPPLDDARVVCAAPVPALAAAIFGAAAPREAPVGGEFVARFVATPPGEERRVLDAVRAADGDARLALAVTPIEVATGANVRVRLRARYLRCAAPERSFVWQGRPVVFDFEVEVDDSARPGPVTLAFDIAVAGTVLDTRHVAVTLVARGGRGEAVGRGTREDRGPAPQTAFASYARADRGRVLDRVAALRSAAGIDVFTDCLSLRPGDIWKSRLEAEIAARDRFLLFWSASAAISPWVRWEWETALRMRGVAFIQPQPLEPVERAPVPQELAELHFDDWVTRLADVYSSAST